MSSLKFIIVSYAYRMYLILLEGFSDDNGNNYIFLLGNILLGYSLLVLFIFYFKAVMQYVENMKSKQLLLILPWLLGI